MLQLFPTGFEEVEHTDGGIELVAYTDAGGEERLWQAFGGARSSPVEPGWEDRWRDFHRPVSVGQLWVGPPWETPAPGLGAVVIDPGRAFGTGAHATTRLCLALLQEQPFGSLLDIGCGSGVLSIAAAVLGFAPVLAVDNDPAAVEATLANAAANGVTLRAELVAGDEPLPSADVAVANISAASVAALSGRVDAARLITSGYLITDEPAVVGYERLDRRRIDGWVADVHARV